METLHNFRYPGETKEYRLARNKLLTEEIKLRRQLEALAEQRRNLPPGGKVQQDYTFAKLNEAGSEESIRLSELFVKDKPSLIIYSFMYGPDMANPCAMCASIIDALNSNAEAVQQHANLVVVAKSPIHRIHKFANSRGWDNIDLLSSAESSYNIDYYGEDDQGNQWPSCNVFRQTDDGIFHFYGTELLHVAEAGMDQRHMDFMWPLWNYLDIIPEGRGSWYPKLSYTS
jgi:predicted dithiol-disulfide oxidoreductase (DUF899 family)